MRTAITIAKTHAGKWQMLATPDDSLIEQKKNFRAFRADKAHAEFASVHYQESDGHMETIRLLTPKAHEAQKRQAKKDEAAARAFDEQARASKTKHAAKQKDKSKLNPDGSDPEKGPTVEEYVKASYDPHNYPPTGFKSRSTPEEIAKAIADFDAKKDAEATARVDAEAETQVTPDLTTGN